jgi:hypothetical protein
MAAIERLLKQDGGSRSLRVVGSGGWRDLYPAEIGYVATRDVFESRVPNEAIAPASGGSRNAS